MSRSAIAHIQKNDPILAKVIEEIEELSELKKRSHTDYFYDLCESIVSQQLSVKASDTIFSRFRALFPSKKPTPKVVLQLSSEKLRSVGLSQAKAKYIKDLAEKVLSQDVNLKDLDHMSDEEVIVELTKIKGIGRWTAEMFLIFSLGREDVFSFGDLGLKNALYKIYQLESPTQEEIEKIVLKWMPYRSFASRVLWKSLNNTPKE